VAHAVGIGRGDKVVHDGGLALLEVAATLDLGGRTPDIPAAVAVAV